LIPDSGMEKDGKIKCIFGSRFRLGKRPEIQDSLASLAPRVRDARKGIIFRTARVGILAERLFFIAGLHPR